MIAQFTADYAVQDVLDNGDIPTFEANFVAALTKAIGAAFSVGLLHYCVDGDVAANVLDLTGTTPKPDFTTLAAGTTLLIRVLTTNTGAVSVKMPHGLGTLALINPDGSSMAAGQVNGGGLVLCSYDGSALEVLASMNSSGTVTITNASAGEGINVQTSSPYAVSLNFPGLAHNATIHDTDIVAYYNGVDGHHRSITWAEIKAAIIAAIAFPAADNPLSRDGTTGHYKIARATVDKNGVGVGHAATDAEIAARQSDPAGDGFGFLRPEDIPKLPGISFGYGVGQYVELSVLLDPATYGPIVGSPTVSMNATLSGARLKLGGPSPYNAGFKLGVSTLYQGSLPPDNAVYRCMGLAVGAPWYDTNTTILYATGSALYRRES